MIVDKKEFQQMKALVDQQQEQIKLLLTGFGQQQKIVAPVVAANKKRHLKIVVGFNEEIKNGDFAEPLLPMRLTKTALSVFDEDDKRSDCG